MTDYIAQLVAYFKQYPELLAIVAGYAGAWSVSATLEYFLPQDMPQRRQQQITLLASFLTGAPLSALVWAGVDGAEKPEVNYGISAVVGVSSPWLYILVSKALGHFFPWASAWTPVTPLTRPPTT